MCLRSGLRDPWCLRLRSNNQDANGLEVGLHSFGAALGMRCSLHCKNFHGYLPILHALCTPSADQGSISTVITQVVDYALNKRTVVRQWSEDGRLVCCPDLPKVLAHGQPNDSGSTAARVVTIDTETRAYNSKRPTYWLLFVSAILVGVVSVYADSDTLWEVVIASVAFLVLRDGPLDRENMAIGKAVGMNLFCACVATVTSWVLMTFSSFSTHDAAWSPTEEVLYHGIHKLSTFTQVLATLFTGNMLVPVSEYTTFLPGFLSGNLIARVYRYEATRSSFASSDRGDHVELEALSGPPPYVESVDAHDSALKGSQPEHPSGELREAFSKISVPSLFSSPQFSPLSTPIASFALFTYLFAYALALLLAESHTTVGHGYIMSPPLSQGSIFAKSLMEVLLPTPPRIMAWVLVPMVIFVACKWHWNKVGREMWEYEEKWMILKEEHTLDVEGQNQTSFAVENSQHVSDSDLPDAHFSGHDVK